MLSFITSETVTPEYILFWNGIFSQWDTTSFTIEGEKFTSCEQWMMACKARVFGDTAARDAIMLSTSSRRQKSLGRAVRNWDQATWDAVKFEIVTYGNWARAQEDAAFKAALLESGILTIVEASYEDAIWGIGFPADTALNHIDEWGENLLGLALMRVRWTLLSNATIPAPTI